MPELTPLLREKLIELFNVLDKDNNGSLDADEFMVLARAMGVDADKEQSQRQIDRADKDRNGSLELEEWLEFSRVLVMRGEEVALRTVERLVESARDAQSARDDGGEGR